MIKITLTEDEVKEFLKPIAGKGEGQNLVKELQNKISNNSLELTDAMSGKIIRYINEYGNGGFQDRLRIIQQAIQAIEAIQAIQAIQAI